MYIKICGITSATDARMVAKAGANAIGLNFYPGSPRAIEPAKGVEIVVSLPPYVDPVGLFVNCTASEVRSTALPLGLKTVQLHGEVTADLVADLRDFAVIAAFPLANEASVQSIEDFLGNCRSRGRLPSAILIDAHVDGKYGGTAQNVPWPLARSFVQRSPVPVVLAGGLTVKNVAEAVRTVGPWGVDVATGVEVAPGRKEQFKVNRFIEEVRKSLRQR